VGAVKDYCLFIRGLSFGEFSGCAYLPGMTVIPVAVLFTPSRDARARRASHPWRRRGRGGEGGGGRGVVVRLARFTLTPIFYVILYRDYDEAPEREAKGTDDPTILTCVRSHQVSSAPRVTSGRTRGGS